MNIKIKKLILPVIITAFLSGCGPGEEAYDKLPRSSEQVLKSQIKTDQVYLYMPSMGRAPKYAVSMSPFTQGQEKLVTLSFDADTEQSQSGRLEIRELNSDVVSQAQLDSGDLGRWLGSQVATAPIMSIPGEFVDYQCAEDSYDDCTNKEETVDPKEVNWQDRKFFDPDFTDVSIKERTWDDLYTFANGCLTKSGSPRLATDSTTGWKGYEIAEDGSINFELEQDYVVANSWGCMINALSSADWNMSNMSFTASQFYSLVPLDALRSKDYEPIVYRQGDEDTYGFFTAEHETTDESYISGNFDQEFKYMDRVNPKSSELVYYLSDSFDENDDTKFFKQITIDAINKINPQLKEAGVPQIVLKEPAGIHPGDLRYNVINLIDEPLSNGLAGYGPTAANPLTGEIVHGHVNQYSGVLRSISDWLWDSIVTDYNADRIVHVEAPSDTTTTTTTESTDTATASTEESVSPEVASSSASSSDADRVAGKISASPASVETTEQVLAAYQELDSNGSSDDEISKLSILKELETNLWEDNNMFPVTEMRLGSSIKEMPSSIGGRTFDFQRSELWIDGEVGGDTGKLKKWAELSDDVKAELGIYLAGVYYGKTIVHELGHNLGLRHNFKGSNDADNYFTEDEAAEYGLTAVPAYTSIMDYNPSMLNALPVYGPYDLAALRFGYKREVEKTVTTTDEETAEDVTFSEYVNISDYDKAIYNATFDSASLSTEDATKNAAAYNGVVEALGTTDTLKEYKFCTDGNVSLNADCNRHDEGRNVEEITDFKLERYDDLYTTRNYRGERANFDEDTISSYAIARIFEFQSWRDAIHNYDSYTEYMSDDYGFDWTLGDRMYAVNNWGACSGDYGPTEFTYEYYCSSAKAIDHVRNKLIDIILEPEHVCEVTTTSAGVATVKYHKLADIIADYGTRDNYDVNEVPESCFDEHVLASIDAYVADNDDDFITGSTVEITAETGKYLNSGSAPRPAPVNNYSNYIDYLGYWGDKLAAASVFVDRVGMRSSTSRADHALSDYNGIAADNTYTDPTADLLNQLILGYDQTVTFTDASGAAVAASGEFAGITWDDTLERMPYYGSATIRSYFDIPKYEKIPLIEAILKTMIKQAKRNSDEQDYEDFLERISLREDSDSSNVRTYTRTDGKIYYATEGNEYAWQMIGFVDDIDRLNAIAETIYAAEAELASTDATDTAAVATATTNLATVKADALTSYAALNQNNDYYTQFYTNYASDLSDNANVELVNEWYDYRVKSLEHLPTTED